MGIIMDAAMYWGMTKIKPKPVTVRDERVFGTMNIHRNFVIFGGAGGSLNERKSIEALNSKIFLCHRHRHPIVILTSDQLWANRLFRTFPDITAFGMNAGYQPFGCNGDRSVSKYMTDGIVEMYRASGLMNNGFGQHSDMNRDYLNEFITILFNVLERNYGARGLTYQHLRTMANAIFNTGGINGFVKWLRRYGCSIDDNSIQALNRIWSNHLTAIRTFWETMENQFAPYTSNRFIGHSTNIYSALRRNRMILFYVRNISSDMLRAAIFRDISMVGSNPFPYCIIDHNVPFASNELHNIFAPNGNRSVEFGMYFTAFNRFNADISSISAVLDDIICVGARNAGDAESIASQFRYMVYRWMPHIDRHGIGAAKAAVPNIEANLLLAGKNGVPDGCAYVFNNKGLQYLHSYNYIS